MHRIAELKCVAEELRHDVQELLALLSWAGGASAACKALVAVPPTARCGCCTPRSCGRWGRADLGLRLQSGSHRRRHDRRRPRHPRLATDAGADRGGAWLDGARELDASCLTRVARPPFPLRSQLP